MKSLENFSLELRKKLSLEHFDLEKLTYTDDQVEAKEIVSQIFIRSDEILVGKMLLSSIQASINKQLKLKGDNYDVDKKPK